MQYVKNADLMFYNTKKVELIFMALGDETQSPWNKTSHILTSH